MEHTSKESAPIIVRADNTTKKACEAVNSEEFLLRIQGIWSKIALLENVGAIQNEEDRFNYAYRFAEIELQKVFIENVSLKERLNRLST